MDLRFDNDLHLSNSGDLLCSVDEELLIQSIYIRLKTKKGSNVFHPEYGNEVSEVLSENISNELLNKAAIIIKECIEQDARLEVINVEASILNEQRRIIFRISFKEKDNDQILDMVWGDYFG